MLLSPSGWEVSENATARRFSWDKVAPPGMESAFFPLLAVDIADIAQGEPG